MRDVKLTLKEDHEKKSLLKYRSTSQWMLPLTKKDLKEKAYSIYPSFTIRGVIHTGFDSLAEFIASTPGNIIIEGYTGVYWLNFIKQTNDCLKKHRVLINWRDISTCYKPAREIEKLIKPYLNNPDPLFGKIYPGELVDFFDQQKLADFQPVTGEPTILYGIGSALSNWAGTLIYVDVPKNEIQFRSRAMQVTNLGKRRRILTKKCKPVDSKLQYKQFYFIEWPVLNRHKQKLLPQIAVFIDEQRIRTITWITGPELREALDELSKNAFRARPWFEPGVWGGDYLKSRIEGLNKAVPNYAWSFELISPENGIILENTDTLLEVSFDLLLYHRSAAVLGKAAQKFGNYFPIRFDFLDTMNGGNLSLQCHPTVSYINKYFGEKFTQDESYYILETADKGLIYLGFQENINPLQLRDELENSFLKNVPVEIEQYVQTFAARKHQLYLIPNGTVHCSGTNNLVLEISATPYIYTFKMYDWLRPDLTGNPRTLNLDRAFENLDFCRKGDIVGKTLLSQETLIKEGSDFRILNLSTHEAHYYAVQRYEFLSTLEAFTNGQCHVLNLVEGACIEVQTPGNTRLVYFAETFIIPAAAITYKLINRDIKPAKVINAFVKDEYC